MPLTSSEAAETATSSQSRYDYDVVPYRGVPEPLAHPARLEFVAALRGLKPTPPKHARVLELGCGTGANLLPLGIEYPDATIVGCDLAATAVAAGRRMAEELGLTNVELRHANLSEVDDSWGEFDYIVCHDVFSWVPPEAQQKILEIQGRRLAPHGVAFLSHDLLPAWHSHDAVLGMLRDYTSGITDFRARIDRARAWIAMASQATDHRAAALVYECWSLSAIPDEHLYHLLSDAPHRAFYAHELAEVLESTQLKLIGDADGTIDHRAHSFRRALLCRKDATFAADVAADVVRKSCAGLARSAVVTEADGGDVCLSTRATATETLCSTDRAICDALRRLRRDRPALVPFAELVPPDCVSGVDFILKAFAAGLVDLVLSPFALTNDISDAPMVSRLARFEAHLGTVVTNCKSQPVRLNPPMQFVVQRLDGQLTLAKLAETIETDRRLAPPESSHPSPFADLSLTAPEIVAHCLRQARDSALLIA